MGRPDGTVPTTLTPWASRCSTTEAIVASTTAMRGAGHIGLSLMMTRMRVSVATAMINVGSLVCPTTDRKDRTCSTMLSPSTEVPVTLPNCPTIISTAPPAR
jgi:hypothetical protein